jgi:outer membrane biosynthesis protein TonB
MGIPREGGRTWIVAAAISLVLHVAAVGAVATAARADLSEDRLRTIPLLSRRDISFLMGYIRESAEALREQEAVSTAKEGIAEVPPSSGASDTGVVKAPPRVKPRKAEPVKAKVPPARKPPEPEPVPPEPETPPEKRPKPPDPVPPVTVDAALVEAVGASDAPTVPDLRMPHDRYLYIQRLRQRIARNCQFLLTRKAQDARGVVIFDVIVHRTGAIREIRYRQHSGFPSLDVLAEQAMLRSAPFPPFYQAMDMSFVCYRVPIRFGRAPRRGSP